MAKTKVQRVTNKNLKTGEEITYLQTRAAGKYDGDDLMRNIESEHSVKKAQVKSTLEALMPSVFEYLRAGNSVEIPGFGMVRIVISSKAQSNPKNATLNVTILPNRLLFAATARHTHNSGFTGKKDYTFADASLTYKTKKKQEFVLSLDNIFNTHTFISRSNSDLTEYYSIYHLRPRSVMLKTHLNL